MQYIQSAPGIKGVIGSMLGLTTIAVGLRFYARKREKLPLKLDDWVVLPAWITFVGICGATQWAVHNNFLGYPTPTDPEAESAALQPGAAYEIVLDILLAACLGLTKISALLFYRRIFCTPGYWSAFSLYLHILTAMLVMWTITYIVIPPLQCGSHITAMWSPDHAVYKKYCSISKPYLFGQVISDFLFELIVLVSPMPSIYKLHTDLKRRFAIAAVFLTASVSLGASIANMVTTTQFSEAAETGHLVDINLANTESSFLNILEAGLALVAVNLPSLFVLRKSMSMQRIFVSIRSAVSLRLLRTDSQAMDDDVESETVQSSQKLRNQSNATEDPNSPQNGNPRL